MPSKNVLNTGCYRLMKQRSFILAAWLGFGVGFSACEPVPAAQTIEPEVALAETVALLDAPEAIEVEVTDPNFPLTLLFPRATDHQPEVDFNASFGRLEARAGSGFSYIIEEKPCDLDSYRLRAESGVFQIAVEHESDTLLIYKASLPDGSMAGYHFCQCLTRAGKSFVVTNDLNRLFNKSEVLAMSEYSSLTR